MNSWGGGVRAQYVLCSTPGEVETQQHSISSGLFSTGEGRAGRKSLRGKDWVQVES